MLRQRRGRRGGQHVAARGVDLAVQHQRHRLAGARRVQVAVHGDDAGDARLDSRGGVHHRVARPQRAGGHRAGIAAERLVRPRDQLHRQPERPRGAVMAGLGALQGGEQAGALVPRHAGARGGDVVAVARADRDRGHRQRVQVPEHGVEVADDTLEHRLVEAHQVHLVDRQHHVADAEQGRDRRVPAGLVQHPLARVDQHDGEVGVRRAGHHVAGVLLVAGRVGQDEAAAWGLEVAVGDVDGDALVALGRQAIDQQRVVDVAPRRAEAAGVALQHRHDVVGDGAALEQQAADQGGFAVVHAAAGQHAEERIGHQKYPSRFLASIEASWSWSISRPARSETRVVRISATISSSVAAGESTAAESG